MDVVGHYHVGDDFGVFVMAGDCIDAFFRNYAGITQLHFAADYSPEEMLLFVRTDCDEINAVIIFMPSRPETMSGIYVVHCLDNWHCDTSTWTAVILYSVKLENFLDNCNPYRGIHFE